MDKHFLDSTFESELRQALAVPEVDSAFTSRLYDTLQLQAAAHSRQKRIPNARQRRTSRWVWITAVLVVAVTLFVFRQPVMASIGRLFGYAYVPEVGFVAVDKVRVLENAVKQTHNDRSVTVTQGLATRDQTSIWLTFSEEARPADGAWMETPEGERYELINWAYSPDEVGTTGVVVYFPSLPETVIIVTLVLPEGWHLPLTWVSGVESNLIPANITMIPPSGEEEVTSTAIPQMEPCAETFGVTFCVQAVAREGEDMHVLVESTKNGPYSAGDSNFPMFIVLDEVVNVALSDDTGQSFGVASDKAYSQGEQEKMVTTLTFPGAAGLTGPLQVTFPAVLVSLPIEEELVIDLGDDPQPGQVIPLDQTLEIEGYVVHFSQATLEGESEITLTVSIKSDPIDDTASVRIYSLEPGRPEGVQDRYGAGIAEDRFSLHVQLYQNSEILTGVLRIPLIKASLKVRGPFVLDFEAPQEITEPTMEPEVVDDAAYNPMPTGEPLSMEAYFYSGETLRGGDLFSVEVEEGTSRLYAASPDDGFAQRLIAVLPGEVMAAHAHNDLQGLDYLAGTREETGNYQYDQLYSVRFAEEEPVLLINQFGKGAFEFGWSYDSRFLAYKITKDTPGEQEESILKILDLACRSTGDCIPVSVFTSQGLGSLVWSPVSYQIAFAGESTGYQDSDISLLNLDPDTFDMTVENLTQSPQIRDFGSMVWAPSGDRLFYPCEAGLTEINEYSLCGTELAAPGDQIIEKLLPWNMHSIHMAGGRLIVDAYPVMQDGYYRIRVYDLNTGESRLLLEWPAENKYMIETHISTSGTWMAVTRGDSTGFQVINIETQAQYWLESVQNEQTYYGGWVP